MVYAVFECVQQKLALHISGELTPIKNANRCNPYCIRKDIFIQIF